MLCSAIDGKASILLSDTRAWGGSGMLLGEVEHSNRELYGMRLSMKVELEQPPMHTSSFDSIKLCFVHLRKLINRKAS